MRVLHLTSDWKWTGPAEPMLLLLQALRSRGHAADLICAEPPHAAEMGVASQARQRGAAPSHSVLPARGIRWWRDAADARRLAQWLRTEDIDVVHAWHSRDHALAIRASRGTRTAVVRSLPSADPIAWTPWNRWLFGPATDGLLCVGQQAARAGRRLRGGRPIAGCLGAVDLDRFSGPGRAGQPSRPELRAKLGLPPDAPVIGVVARVQRHRRFDLLLGAMRELIHTHPEARLLIVGRGTHIEEVAGRPIEALGLGQHVSLAGYRQGDYPDVLRELDLLTFLVPGSDGTCRAVLEAAACGVPSVATRRGALPEIVRDGKTGLLIDETPEALVGAWRQLIDDSPSRRRLGSAALERARSEFRPARLAEDVEALYAAAISCRRAS